VPNFLGYLPALTNGATLVTQGGKTLTVTITGSEYCINNAKITQANIILPNGVAHVVDAVVRANPPAAVSSGIMLVGNRGMAGAITTVFLLVLA
jgi:hypothetical protein